jgi:hypothetical protein
LIAVELTSGLAGEHRALVLRYLGEAERFSSAEWVTLLEAFTLLGDSIVRLDEEIWTFQGFYDRFIEQSYGDRFIADLLAQTDIPAHAPTIQAAYARQVYQQLRTEPFALGGGPEAECLLAYSLYWWSSFARGYAFEAEIFRDLEAAGVHFVAHDLRVREERFSPCDLTVLGMTGDIKSTTYFLYVARSFPLTSDFYVARLYHPTARRYVRIVILTHEAWRRIDGETVSSDLTRVAQLLPRVVNVTFLSYDLVVADYEVWREQVLRRQDEGVGRR